MALLSPRGWWLPAATLVALAVVASSASPRAWAEPSGGEESQGTIRLVLEESGSYPGPDDDPETFYGLFSLEGACGFERARIGLDYTESFLVGLHQRGASAGQYNAVGKISDEAFTFQVLDAGGADVDTYTGTADEHATAVGVLTEDDQELHQSNYSFVGTATNGTSTLRLRVKGRWRTDPRTGELQRFDYAITSCRVG